MDRFKIAFYSHDAMGLGHLRRNLLLAEALTRSTFPSRVLLTAGAPELHSFPIPAGIDCVTLPALRKDENGSYVPRNDTIPLAEMLTLRSEILRTTLETFDPDVLVVDKHPRGILGELDASLERLTSRGTRLVLGLRDVLDAPETVRREWARESCHASIRRHFDEVWVYGDPGVYDMRLEYTLPADIAARVTFLGYLNPRLRMAREEWDALPAQDGLPDSFALCLVGGGQDGAALAGTFADALPSGRNGVIVTGPFMPLEAREDLKARARANRRIQVREFDTHPGALIARADRVVSMGGYNTVCEVLAAGKPLLVVPRVHPRVEQWIRAERMVARGLLASMHPARVNPESIRTWLQSPSPPPAVPANRFDFGGLTRLPEVLRNLMAGEPQPRYAMGKAG